MDSLDLRLDGNAIGGLLGELFTHEMTSAGSCCAACGSVEQVGSLVVFEQAPGTVARCPHCMNVLMRIVHGGGRYWLDLSGLRWLELREGL